MVDGEEKIRIALVDDQPIFRKGARCAIQDEEGIEIVAEARSDAQVVNIISELDLDIIILNIDCQDLDDISLINRIVNLKLDVKVISVSTCDDLKFVQKAFDLGASGYILRDISIENFTIAVRTVHRGDLYIDPSILEQWITDKFENARNEDASLRRDSLTERERAVIRFTALGFTGKEISQKLGISSKSVETFKARACKKLDIRSRAAIVRYALVQDWLRDPIP
jgi:DNA-binding NarL/FixJ family response regulator